MGSTSSLPVFTAAVATYAVHSTMLLTVVWLIARMPVVKSHAIREQLWKWAAVAPPPDHMRAGLRDEFRNGLGVAT
jgi:hypothetical protein